MQSINTSTEGFTKQHDRRNEVAKTNYLMSAAEDTLYDHKTNQEISDK
jgi:hypothetical protein